MYRQHQVVQVLPEGPALTDLASEAGSNLRQTELPPCLFWHSLVALAAAVTQRGRRAAGVTAVTDAAAEEPEIAMPLAVYREVVVMVAMDL
jgi:hypothetical protein